MKKIIAVAILNLILLNSCITNKQIQTSSESVKLKASKNNWTQNKNHEKEESFSDDTYMTQSLSEDISFQNEMPIIQATGDNIEAAANNLEVNNFEQNQILTEPLSECDFIVCKNGDEIEAKVLEIGENEIKYKRCDNTDGPTISIRSSEVLMIKYPNGTKDIIKSSSKTTSYTITKEQNDSTSGKSQIVAIVLCLFLGAFGIHRFYLGYPGMGILMLLTGGLFGILWLIDLILLLTGGLKPKNGDYTDSF